MTSPTALLSPNEKFDEVQKQKVNGAQLNPDVKKDIQKVLVANIQKKAALQQQKTLQQQQSPLNDQQQQFQTLQSLQTQDGQQQSEDKVDLKNNTDQSFVITPDYIQQSKYGFLDCEDCV